MQDIMAVRAWVIILGMMIAAMKVREMRTDYNKGFKDDTKDRLNIFIESTSVNLFSSVFIIIIVTMNMLTFGFVFASYSLLSGALSYIPLIIIPFKAYSLYTSLKPFRMIVKAGKVENEFENMKSYKIIPITEFLVVAITIGILI